MKRILFLFAMGLGNLLFAQSIFPAFLEGVWKHEGKETYEQWTLLNANSLKGISYQHVGETPVISEYLEIFEKQKKIYYSATLKEQNGGESVQFTLTKSDSIFRFENKKHDFPNLIEYKKISDSLVDVVVKDNAGKGFQFRMQKQPKPVAVTQNQNPNYNATLAAELGADDYGMKSFWLVILKTGTNNSTDADFINTQFRGHLKNINRLVKENKMIVAGPFGKNDLSYRGVFILSVEDEAEAKSILQSDPAIKSGLLGYELIPWYGSAALPTYLPASELIWKVKP